MKNRIDRDFSFAMDSLNAHLLNKKLNLVFDSLKCAAELNIGFGFVLKIAEIGSGLHYSNENNTLMERSKLVAAKEILKKLRRC